MKTTILILIHCFALPLAVLGNRFVCYYPNWAYYKPGEGNFKVNNIDPSLCTDLIYAFAILNEYTYEIQINDVWVDIDNRGYADFVALKLQNPNLRTTIALGGWNDSHFAKKYSEMVASNETRAVFITSVVKFLQLHNFDGLDFDWEYPSSDSDKIGLANLLRELRSAFETQYTLSVAVAANTTIIEEGYDLETLAESVDYINLKAFDLHGPWEPQTDHHAPLFNRSLETEDNNADYVVNYFLERDFPASKINLGIPLYGNSWTLGESVEPMLQALGSGPGAAGPFTQEPGVLAYYEICDNIRNGGWQTIEDVDHLNGPYAFSPNTPKVWVGYDDSSMAAVKSQYILDNQLAGAMVWDLSTDDFRNLCGEGVNPILTTISEKLVDGGARLVCYFPHWGYYRTGNGKYVVENIDANLCTDVVYAFAALDGTSNTIVPFDPFLDINQQYYMKFVALKNQNPSLKTTISIGGWADSHDGTNKYSNMVANTESRATFINSVVQFLERFGFDGLDLDWEYPSSASDKVGFANLLLELRAAFGNQYSLSVAVPANVTLIDLGYEVSAITEAADYVNVMTYDMHGPWENKTDHHAPLYARQWDVDATNNIDSIIKYWKTKGLPSSKINMGIPLYGRTWTLNYTYTSDPTLPAPGLGPGAAGPFSQQQGYLGYNEICKNIKENRWVVEDDPEYRIGPYAHSPNVPMTWVGYDDAAMASVKSRYAMDRNLGGVMVWDLSTDDFRNVCGDGANPVMTEISRTLLSDVNTTPVIV